MIYLNEGLKRYLEMKDNDLRKKISDNKGRVPTSDFMIVMFLLGVAGTTYLSTLEEEYKKNPDEFNSKITKMEAELNSGLKAHDLTAQQEVKIKKGLLRLNQLKSRVHYKKESYEYLDEGVLTFIKKQNYNYLKKIDAGSVITSEEIILGFCVGAIPAVIVAQLVRSKLKKDPGAFKQKLNQMKEELEAVKKENELNEEENSKTNKMILKITALNVLISNVIKSINNRHFKHNNEI